MKQGQGTEYSYLNYNNIKIEVNKILKDITVSTGGQLFRKYTINHETVSGNYQRVKSKLKPMVQMRKRKSNCF